MTFDKLGRTDSGRSFLWRHTCERIDIPVYSLSRFTQDDTLGLSFGLIHRERKINYETYSTVAILKNPEGGRPVTLRNNMEEEN